MFIPLGHEQMSARRWPYVTFALIALNVLIFIGTNSTIERQGSQLAEVKSHVLMLAAMHPELEVPEALQPFVQKFQEQNPETWKILNRNDRPVADGFDAQARIIDEPGVLQAQLDDLAEQYTQLSASALTEQYAFIPSDPKPLAYLTANFLHGG